MAMSIPLLLIHGGAGDIPDSRVHGKLDGIREALKIGYENYATTNDILDASQAAVEYMELDRNFNAGYGSVLTRDGEIELEALVVDGKNLEAGAVTGLKNILHPIAVARKVMEQTPHVLLSGEGAQQFAEGCSFPLESSLHTPEAWEALRVFKEKGKNPCTTEIGSGGTVGAVGIDSSGRMVSCTSTGGITGKMKGRVGDTPIPGSGGAADNFIGAVSTTGFGDAILRYNVAQRILLAMESGQTAQEASENVLNAMLQRIGKTAGAITIAKDGNVGVAFTSKRMAWAYMKDGQVHYGINKGDHFIENFRS